MQVFRFRSPHPHPAMRHSYALLVANWFERIALKRMMRRHQGLAPVTNMPYAKAIGATFVLRAKPESTMRRNSDFVQSSWYGHDAATLAEAVREADAALNTLPRTADPAPPAGA